MTSLVRYGQPHGHEIAGLRVRVAAGEAALAKRAAEVARVRAGLDAFKIRYRHEAGLLHEQLDDLERAISDAELGNRVDRPDADASGPTASVDETRTEPAPRFTSDGMRKLFRDVAKAVHPDLAGDEQARHRRHTLMIEANRAYALGDEDRLRVILESWENSPEAVTGSDPEAIRLRLVRRMAEIEEQLTACDGDLADLRDSPVGKLKAMVDEAAARGKDAIGDMVKRLKRDIMVARNRLDAIQPRP